MPDFSLKRNYIRLVLRPDPAEGAHSPPLNPIAGFMEKGRKEKERKGERRGEGDTERGGEG